jgi:hypothetical protein
MRSPQVKEMIRRLTVSQESCESVVLDLSEYRFCSTDAAMWLEHKANILGSEKYYFRMDPDQPRDPEINHGILQFCKMLKIPGKFFRENRPQMRETFARNWFATLVPEDPSSLFQLRIRRGLDHQTIRAILKTDIIDLPHCRILEALLPEESEIPVDILQEVGGRQDMRTLEASFLVSKEFPFLGEKFRMGLHLEASELGCSDIKIEAFLYNSDDWSVGLPFDFSTLFVHRYKNAQPMDVESLLRGIVPDLISRIPDLEQISETFETVEFPGLNTTTEVVVKNLKSANAGLLRRAVSASGTEIGEGGEEVTLEGEDHPMWGYLGFAREMGRIAHDLPRKKKLEMETAAGLLLNLNLPRR